MAGRSRDERHRYDQCLVYDITHVLCSRHGEACCGGGVVGSRRSSGVSRRRLLTVRAWHGWCVADVLVAGVAGADQLFRACGDDESVCGFVGVIRWLRVLESCEPPRSVVFSVSCDRCSGVAAGERERLCLYSKAVNSPGCSEDVSSGMNVPLHLSGGRNYV